MPTIIDALVMTLGLDASSFAKGQKEAVDTLDKTKISAKKSLKDTEDSSKSLFESINKLKREVLGLFAAFTAGQGLESFAKTVAQTDAAIGRLANNLQSSPETLSAWQGAAERMGGSAAATAGSLQGLSDRLQEMRNNGDVAGMTALFKLQGQSGVTIDTTRGSTEEMLGIADALHRIQQTGGANKASWFGRQLGIDDATVNVLMKGRQAVVAMLQEQQRLGVVTKEDAAAGVALQDAWTSLIQASTAMGRTLLTWLSPALVTIAKYMTDLSVWARQHGPFLKALFLGLSAAVVGLGVALAIPYAGLIALVSGIVSAVTAIALLVDDWAAWTKGGKSEFETFWRYVDTAWQSFKTLVPAILDAVKGDWHAFHDDIIKLIKSIVNYFSNSGPDIAKAFRAAFSGAINWLKGQMNEISEVMFGHKMFSDVSAGSDGGAVAGGAGSGSGHAMTGNDAIAQRGRTSRGRPSRPELNANSAAAMDELRKAGYSDNAIAAVLGSMQTESSFNPRAHNAVSGGHTGAWQWDATRWPKIASWIRSKGGDPWEFRWQTKAWVAEHNARPGDAIYDNSKTEAGGRALRGAPSIETAIHGVQMSERFGVGEEGGRANNARGWLPRVNGGGVGPDTRAAVRRALTPPKNAAAFNGMAGAAVAGAHHHATHILNDSDVSIGKIEVHTPAVDGKSVAHAMRSELYHHLKKNGIWNQATYGLK